MDQNVFDIAVVGAGPAGSVAAFAAARRGLRVALIDRQTFPRDKTCGDGIGPGVVQVVRQLGIEEIFDGWNPVPAVTVYGPSGVRSESAIPKIDGKTLHGYVIPRFHFDNSLFRLAIGAGATDLSGMKFLAMTRSANYRNIDLCSSSGVGQTISAHLVIGADGAYSAVRKSLFGSDYRIGPKFMGLAMRAYAESDDFQLGGRAGLNIVFDFNRKRLPFYGWAFPLGEGKINIGVGGPLVEMHRYDMNIKDLLQDLTEQFRSRGINIGALYDQRAHHMPTIGGSPPLTSTRAVLIGDAAAMINPTSGEGIAYGVTAAAQLIASLPTSLEEDRHVSEALAEFERGFNREYRMHFLSSRATSRLLHRPAWSAMLVRAMQADPRVLDAAVDMMFGYGSFRGSTILRVLRATLMQEH
jgi:menaquinone-9 beta-reductase